MQDIHPIYQNKFGVSFQWKRNIVQNLTKVQLVFRDTGLLLTKEELLLFSSNIQHTSDNKSLCSECIENTSCRALLVDSPAAQISFAFNLKELEDLKDLVEGTIFQMELDNYLGDICSL